MMSTPTVPVTISLADQNGNPFQGAKISATLNRNELYNGIVVPNQNNVTTDVNGLAVLHLFPNQLGSQGSQYLFRIPQPNGKILSVTGTVPNAACELSNIVNMPVWPSAAVGQASVDAAIAAMGVATTQAGIATAAAGQAAADVVLTHADAAQVHADALAVATQAQAVALAAPIVAADAAQVRTDALAVAAHAATVATTAPVVAADSAAAVAAKNAAGLSQAAAAGSAVNAGLSETGAGQSAVSANASAQSLNQALASFRAKYLGSFAIDPLLDGNGAALTAGAEYFNTVSNKLRVYSGTVWADYDAAAQIEVTNAAVSAAAAAGSQVAAQISAASASDSAIAANAHMLAASGSAGQAAASATAALTAKNAVDAQALIVAGNKTAVDAAAATVASDKAITLAAKDQALAAQTASGTSQTQTASSALQAVAARDLSIAAWAASTAPTEQIAAVSKTFFTNSAIVAAIIYDTRKDSDGGAWRKRCGATSWYNETIYGAYRGECANEAACRAISGATTGDFYHNTMDGLFYALNATSGVTQIYRGNRREFPAVVAITAESTRVIIWDLTDSSVPMWMVFTASASTTCWYYGSWITVSSLYALQGKIIIGRSGIAGGYTLVDLIPDNIAVTRIANDYGNGNNNNRVSYRNSLIGNSGPIVVSLNAVNSITATVLPTSPIDPATGLPVPTIAVGTASGVSVIKDDGNTVNLTYTITEASTNFLAFDNSGGIFWGARKAGVNFIYLFWFSSIPSVSTAAQPTKNYTGSNSIPSINNENYDGITCFRIGKYLHALGRSANGVAFLRDTPSSPSTGMVAYVSNTYNTDWMNGDIQAAITVTAANTIADKSVKNLTLTGSVTTAAVATGAQLQSFTPATTVTATLGATIANGCHVHWELVSGVWHNYVSAVSSAGASTAAGYIDGVASNAVPIVNVAVAGGTGVTIGATTVANVRFSKTLLSADQVAYIYETGRQMFAAWAQCFIDGTSSAVTTLAYDEVTDLFDVGTSWGRSTFKGLVRQSSEAATNGAAVAYAAYDGNRITVGATGAKIYIPSKYLRDELNRAAEQKKQFGQQLVKKTFVATSGQTVFIMGLYEVVRSVYQQGVLKDEAAGAGFYSLAYDGFRWTITLGTGATTGDRVTVFYTSSL